MLTPLPLVALEAVEGADELFAAVRIMVTNVGGPLLTIERTKCCHAMGTDDDHVQRCLGRPASLGVHNHLRQPRLHSRI